MDRNHGHRCATDARLDCIPDDGEEGLDGEDVVAVTGRTVFDEGDDLVSRLRSAEIERKYRSRPRRASLANGPCSMFRADACTLSAGSIQRGTMQRTWKSASRSSQREVRSCMPQTPSFDTFRKKAVSASSRNGDATPERTSASCVDGPAARARDGLRFHWDVVAGAGQPTASPFDLDVLGRRAHHLPQPWLERRHRHRT